MSSMSPRLPSPPPTAEIQIGPNSPGPGATANEEAQLMEQTVQNDAKRRIRPGTKSADMAAGPPLVPLNEVRGRCRALIGRVCQESADMYSLSVARLRLSTPRAPCRASLPSHEAQYTAPHPRDSSDPRRGTRPLDRQKPVALRAMPLHHLTMQQPYCGLPLRYPSLQSKYVP